jgi:uncharacterized zinc-type alcohol dehydrogenase-like protein
MAVKMAHAMGAEVSVLSRSPAKQDDARRMGTDHFRDTSDPDMFQRLGGTFDLIVNTVSAKIDLDTYLGLLAVRGTFVNASASPAPLQMSGFSLLMQGRSVAGSASSSTSTSQP